MGENENHESAGEDRTGKVNDESKDRKRALSRNRDRDRRVDRQRSRSRNRDRDRSEGRRGNRSRNRDRDRSEGRRRSRSRNRDSDRSEDRRRRRRSRSRDKERQRRRRSRSRSRDHDRHTSHVRNRDRDREAGKEKRYKRRSRSRSREGTRERASSRDRGGNGMLAALAQNASRKTGDQNEVKPKQKWGKADEEDDGAKKIDPEDKQKANFALSGALNEDSKTGKMYNGVMLKWSEPPDAHNPTKKWRIYIFKGEELKDTLHIHRQSAYLCGREKKIADILIEHPSCSKQHAVIQYRVKTEYPKEHGSLKKPKRTVVPYILDLESTNGSFLNGERLEPARYVQIMNKDVIKFGDSRREYVFMLAE